MPGNNTTITSSHLPAKHIAAAESAGQPQKIPFIRKLFSSGVTRFAGWWTIFAGALALNSVCPICGSTACPVGIGTSGIIAGLVAGVKMWGGRGLKIISGFFRRSRLGNTEAGKADCSCGSHHNHDHHRPL